MRRVSFWRVAPALAPALLLAGVLAATGVLYAATQSLGYLPFIGQTDLSFAAYAALLGGDDAVEFRAGLLFSLWVSGASTVLAAVLALLILLLFDNGETGGWLAGALNLNLAFPHLVWAVAWLLLLSQSGWLARLAASLGWIAVPADFPILVRDEYGIGIILAYVTKEVPFLLLLMLGVLGGQPPAYWQVATTLGAGRWRRLRYVTLPLVLPALLAGSLLVFAFIFGAYELPAILGVSFPRMLAVLALDFFRNADLANRAGGMAIGVLMALVVVAVAAVGWLVLRRHLAPDEPV